MKEGMIPMLCGRDIQEPPRAEFSATPKITSYKRRDFREFIEYTNTQGNSVDHSRDRLRVAKYRDVISRSLVRNAPNVYQCWRSYICASGFATTV